MERSEAEVVTASALTLAGMGMVRITVEAPDKEWAKNALLVLTAFDSPLKESLKFLSSRVEGTNVVIEAERKSDVDVADIVEEAMDERDIDDWAEEFADDWGEEALPTDSLPRAVVHWLSNISSYIEVEDIKTALEPAPKDKAKFFSSVYSRNKGLFYRGVGKSGKGTDVGALGNGLYVTWDRNMAESFALIARGNTVLTYKLPSNLVLLDAQSRTMAIIKDQEFGFKPWQWGKGREYSRIMTERVKELGYDGIASSNREEGIVIFEPRKAKVVKKEEF